MGAENSSLGLKYIGVADVTANAVPTVYTELEDAVIDSASVTENEPTTEDIRIEQSRGIYRTITTEEGSTVFAVQLYDVSVDNLELLKGGTVTAPSAGKGKTWSNKDSSFEVNKAVKLETLDGYKLYIPNGRVVALVTFALAKSGLATVSLTITAQDHTEGSVLWEEPVAGE